MATVHSSSEVRKFGLWRSAAAGAATLGVLFVICWAGNALVGLTGSHMFLELFTRAPVQSLWALAEGLCWALVFGAITGLLAAFFYNLFTREPHS